MTKSGSLQIIGLCAACRHVRPIKSSRGSVFVMCGLAKTNPNFPKYPPLPVIKCGGFEPVESDVADP
ncbi:MAG TPA: hypothetical protein PKE64_22030 [Anaerolineae bacterium]|nr:hypothetical protein [Anaerolineae bacterium]